MNFSEIGSAPASFCIALLFMHMVIQLKNSCELTVSSNLLSSPQYTATTEREAPLPKASEAAVNTVNGLSNAIGCVDCGTHFTLGSGASLSVKATTVACECAALLGAASAGLASSSVSLCGRRRFRGWLLGIHALAKFFYRVVFLGAPIGPFT